MNVYGYSRNGVMENWLRNSIGNDLIYNFIDCIDAFASLYVIEIVFVLFIFVLNQREHTQYYKINRKSILLSLHIT